MKPQVYKYQMQNHPLAGGDGHQLFPCPLFYPGAFAWPKRRKRN